MGIRDLGGKKWSHRDDPSEVANIMDHTSFDRRRVSGDFEWERRTHFDDLVPTA
jgi:hypothetical protein